MHEFMVEFLHNVTPSADPQRALDGGLAIFDRWGQGDRTQPGDQLAHVGVMTIQAPSCLQVLEPAFAIGNGAHELSAIYYGWGVRSLSTGDVVVVHTPDGCPAYSVEGCGFRELANPAGYGIDPGACQA